MSQFFTREFLAGCSTLELAVLQHDLRKTNDREHLAEVLAELKRRTTPPARLADAAKEQRP